MNLPIDVQNIIETLQTNGHEAYAVGGCVRDCILGKIPHDWDITTSAKPDEVKRLFKKTFDTGIEHGTVTVLLNNVGYEVTTYRIDGEYLDGRHPKQVVFTASLEEDLKRRDFTINAMAYNHLVGLVDIFGGEEDLKRGVIKAVGNPKERFTEDALRMLRAMRFAAQLGFKIEEPTYNAICEMAPTLSKVSAERIQVELVKLLCSDHPEMMRKVYESGLSRVFMPELDSMFETKQVNKHHIYDVGEHTIHAMLGVEATKVLRLTMLLHDVAKPVVKTEDEAGQNHFKTHEVVGAKMAKSILQRLKFDNDTCEAVENLVRYHDERPPIEKKAIRRLMVKVSPEAMPDLLKVKKADMLAQSMYNRDKKLADLAGLEALYLEILNEKDCIKIKDMAINGKDLIALGVPQGVKIGKILNALFEEILDDPTLNNSEYLLARAREML